MSKNRQVIVVMTLPECDGPYFDELEDVALWVESLKDGDGDSPADVTVYADLDDLLEDFDEAGEESAEEDDADDEEE